MASTDQGNVCSQRATLTWRLSIPQMTVMVKTREDRRIVEAAPIVRKFVGQPLDDLVRWMDRKGGVDVMLLQSDAR